MRIFLQCGIRNKYSFVILNHERSECAEGSQHCLRLCRSFAPFVEREIVCAECNDAERGFFSTATAKSSSPCGEYRHFGVPRKIANFVGCGGEGSHPCFLLLRIRGSLGIARDDSTLFNAELSLMRNAECGINLSSSS